VSAFRAVAGDGDDDDEDGGGGDDDGKVADWTNYVACCCR
jgi:hypothetical protein